MLFPIFFPYLELCVTHVISFFMNHPNFPTFLQQEMWLVYYLSCHLFTSEQSAPENCVLHVFVFLTLYPEDTELYSSRYWPKEQRIRNICWIGTKKRIVFKKPSLGSDWLNRAKTPYQLDAYTSIPFSQPLCLSFSEQRLHHMLHILKSQHSALGRVKCEIYIFTCGEQ